jgi:hypothetical protein
MQRPHPYPAKRNQWPTVWHLRPGARIDDALPPKTGARTRAIRAIFIDTCGGHASITEVGDLAYDQGLLDGFSTHRSAYEALMVALRPIAAPSARQSLYGSTYGNPVSPAG